ETVLMPGDPLRAKYIAENFLENTVCYNQVRGMYGFTGTYKGKKVSVQGSGMGMPSIGIYSYELITQFGVKNLIRVGSCGSLQNNVKIRDIILAVSASTNSRYVHNFNLPGDYAPTASFELLMKAWKAAETKKSKVVAGNVLSTDIFYDDDPDIWKEWAKMGVLAVEMEAAALYMNAARLGANALAILTVSDSLVTHEVTTSEEREKTFTDMMEIALEII
ncbi:MAG: purine-nucleoside phosphorylase, partial [Clostridiales bacterium]|nr:purine-nucleoside phosphorylase [Clostridiales bacterium]